MRKRNPNGYGCVTKLKGNRLRPYCIKVTVKDSNGLSKQVIIGYAETLQKANILLAEWNNRHWYIDRDKITLNDLYQKWLKVKAPNLGASHRATLKSAYNHCSKYYSSIYRKLRSYHMQECVDECPAGYRTKRNIKTLFSHLDALAYELDIIDKMYSQLIVFNDTIPETTRTPFTQEQIDKLWSMVDKEPYVDTVLIYIYTGFRLRELLDMKIDSQVNLDEWYLQGGSKTAAGKGRIVPIHPRIRPLIQNLVDQNATYLFTTKKGFKFHQTSYYDIWNKIMDKLSIHKTVHETRHTFETNLDNAGANRKCIDMLMGHKSPDIGNRVYNHKTLEQLRDTINLLN